MNFVNTSLFVGDLPKFCTEPDLEQFFSRYGPVLDVKIKRNVNTGKTLSYGFVTLSTEALAQEAIRAFDGAMFLGRKMRVRWAMYNAKTQNPINQSIINSVYVRFVTPKMDQYVTEEDLHRVFDPFGGVLDVSIKESSVDVRTNRQSGYGFVHFSCDNLGVESAFQAVAALDNATLDGVTFNVELSKNLLKQFNSDGTPSRKEDFAQSSFSPNLSNSTSQKSLTSPSRSMNNIYQSLPTTNFQPATPARSCYPDSDPADPFKLSPMGEHITRTPLRNCSSMNAIKLSPAQYNNRSPPGSVESGLRRTLSGRADYSINSSNSPSHYSSNVSNWSGHNQGLVGSPVPAQNNFPSRENSFRSVGGRSTNGSFRTLNARSSSANSMTSSYGTTISCTSSPSPFNNVTAYESQGFDKIQSFRSDPGANRIYATKSSHYGHAFEQSESLLGQSSHSLSFQESPLSRSLFSMRGSQHGASDISLLSIPTKGSFAEFGSSHHLHSQLEVPERPESRASDCSDVSTDNESAIIVLSGKESGLDFFSPNNHESDDFFAFLATGKNSSSNKLQLDSNAKVPNVLLSSNEALNGASLLDPSMQSLDLEKMSLNVFPTRVSDCSATLSSSLL
eukprot:gene9805-10649_t